MTSHTPGPWLIGFDDGSGKDDGMYITASEDRVVVRSGCLDELQFGVQSEADAHLIAAAPDLLEALVRMRAAFWGTSHNVTEDEANAFAARVIVKAIGEDPLNDDVCSY